jgi:hypothetical protein
MCILGGSKNVTIIFLIASYGRCLHVCFFVLFMLQSVIQLDRSFSVDLNSSFIT